MALIETPAILLRTHPYSETSRVLRFHTRELGLLGVMARGVRRGEGKGSVGLDSFAEGVLSVSVRHGRELQTFRDFSLTRDHRGLARHPLRFAGASVMGEVVLRTVEADPNPALFDTLTDTLTLLESVPVDALPATVVGRIWLVVRTLGFGPTLGECVRCGSVLEEGEVGRFDLAGGGVLCAVCAEGRRGPRLGPEARSQLELLLAGKAPEELRRLRGHARLLEKFIRYHVLGGSELRSFPFLLQELPDDA